LPNSDTESVAVDLYVVMLEDA